MPMSHLSTGQCQSCATATEALPSEEVSAFAKELAHNWQVIDGHHLEKTFAFKNFRQALDFTNQIGEIAEAEGHHPDIFLTWGKVRLNIFTHKVNGLTRADFILAAKFEEAAGPG